MVADATGVEGGEHFEQVSELVVLRCGGEARAVVQFAEAL